VRAWSLAAALLSTAVAFGGCLGSGPGGLFAQDAGPKDFLSSKTYTKWVIEVDVAPGMEPPSGVLDLARQRMESLANKPAGVEVRQGSLPSRGGTWTDKDILDFSDAHRDVDTSGKTAALHVMFLDGQYAKTGVLGVTYTAKDGSSSGPVAIFAQSIKGGCGALCLSGTAPAFRTVLVHELGHAVGLVDNGIPMAQPHEAATCNGEPDRGHSSNPNSVMRCDAETSGILNLASTPPNDFDASDRADVCKAGGKC
jgi:hypothetical protein